MKNKIIIVFAVVFILFLMNLLLYCFSYHEKNDYSEILSIHFTSPSKHIDCISEQDVKRMEHRIRKLNFYPCDSEYLPESPQYLILIKYKNGTIKRIDVSGYETLITVTSINGDIIEELSEFYYVNPLSLSLLFL